MRPDVLALDASEIAMGARRLRDLPVDELEDVPPWILRHASGLLRAGAYSAVVAARAIERIALRLDPPPADEVP